MAAKGKLRISGLMVRDPMHELQHVAFCRTWVGFEYCPGSVERVLSTTVAQLEQLTLPGGCIRSTIFYMLRLGNARDGRSYAHLGELCEDCPGSVRRVWPKTVFKHEQLTLHVTVGRGLQGSSQFYRDHVSQSVEWVLPGKEKPSARLGQTTCVVTL